MLSHFSAIVVGHAVCAGAVVAALDLVTAATTMLHHYDGQQHDDGRQHGQVGAVPPHSLHVSDACLL